MESGGFVSTKTDSAIEQCLIEVDKMHREGVTAEELAFSKKGLTGSFALSFETSSQIASALQSIVLYGLPEDYYENYLQNIEKVSLEDVRRVAQSYLDAAKMAVLVVGDLKTVKEGVEKLMLGESQILDSEGEPVH